MNSSFDSLPSLENAHLFLMVTAEEFIMQRDQLHPDLFAFLTPQTKVDYETQGTLLFLSEDKKSGFGINPDGELISVFSLERNRGKTLVAEARRKGARYLSCMGDHLLKMYSEFDFSPVETLKWDNQFAPKNWNYKRFGTPNIYDMKLFNPHIKKFEG